MLGFGLLLLCGLSMPWQQNLAASWAFAVNARSLGMEIALPAALPATSWWGILLLMLVGGAPASTAGGLRVTTLWLLVSSAPKLSAGQSVGRSLGIALFFTGLLLAGAFALFLGLLATQPQLPADRLALIAVGALTNTGLSHNPLSFTGLPLYLLGLGMLAGHLLPLIVAWRMKNAGDWDTPVC
jgi:trk system potassium uptake protein TrkH